jgi:outer membrane immunogenic protein
MKQKQTILASSIALLAVAAFGNAYAADANWAGPYVGVTLGATNYSMDAHDGDANLTYGNLTANKLGAVAGLTAGMNWQAGSFVYGVEADVNLDTTGEARANGWNEWYSARAEKKWNASVRARAGFAVGNVLPYITGGIDFAKVERKVMYDYIDCGDPGGSTNCGSTTKAALTLGAGFTG